MPSEHIWQKIDLHAILFLGIALVLPTDRRNGHSKVKTSCFSVASSNVEALPSPSWKQEQEPWVQMAMHAIRCNNQFRNFSLAAATKQAFIFKTLVFSFKLLFCAFETGRNAWIRFYDMREKISQEKIKRLSYIY